MPVNADERMPKIGLDDLYYALITADTDAAYTAGTPVYLAPAAQASQEPAANAVTKYYDDKPMVSISSEGQTVINLTISGLDPATLATLLGKVFDATNGLLYDNNGTPPYCALLFRSKKSSGGYRYYAYLKGRFSPPKEEHATESDTPDPKDTELVFTAIHTTHEFDLSADVTDTIKRIVGDDDTDSFDGSAWFDAVPVPLYTPA